MIMIDDCLASLFFAPHATRGFCATPFGFDVLPRGIPISSAEATAAAAAAPGAVCVWMLDMVVVLVGFVWAAFIVGVTSFYIYIYTSEYVSLWNQRKK